MRLIYNFRWWGNVCSNDLFVERKKNKKSFCAFSCQMNCFFFIIIILGGGAIYILIINGKKKKHHCCSFNYKKNIYFINYFRWCSNIYIHLELTTCLWKLKKKKSLCAFNYKKNYLFYWLFWMQVLFLSLFIYKWIWIHILNYW